MTTYKEIRRAHVVWFKRIHIYVAYIFDREEVCVPARVSPSDKDSLRLVKLIHFIPVHHTHTHTHRAESSGSFSFERQELLGFPSACRARDANFVVTSRNKRITFFFFFTSFENFLSYIWPTYNLHPLWFEIRGEKRFFFLYVDRLFMCTRM